MKKVFIRVDASNEMGLGHLMRCISLSQVLEAHYEVEFFMRDDSFIEFLKGYGFRSLQVSSDDEFVGFLNSEAIVVLDGYHFSTDLQVAIKDQGNFLVCLDDLHDRHFVSDIVINPSPGVDTAAYSKEADTRVYSGTQYSMLRPPFVQYAKLPLPIKKEGVAFVCFGGADFLNLTLGALEVLVNSRRFTRLIVVTGSAYKFAGSLNQFAEEHRQVQIYSSLNGEEMLELMIQAELAVVPSSGILYEALVAGCAVLSCWYADNQKHFHDYMRDKGFMTSFGDNRASFQTSKFSPLVEELFTTEKVDLSLIRKEIAASASNLLQTFQEIRK